MPGAFIEQVHRELGFERGVERFVDILVRARKRGGIGLATLILGGILTSICI